MSLDFKSAKSKTNTSQTSSSQTDPWDEVIPYLKDFLGKTGQAGAGTPGATPQQTAAIGQLEANAATGNPYAGNIDDLTRDLFATESRAPQVGAAYGDLERRLAPTADGTNINLENNEYVQNLLKTVADDVQWRTNRQFAGAGRDMSGINQQAVARGVSQATAPILLDQYNRETGRTDAAARDLFEAGKSTATTQTDLDKTSAGMRALGTETGKAAIEARDQGPTQILALEEQMKKMPYEELQWLASLLFPAAQLGSQESGQASGTSNTKSQQFGAKADIGTALAALFG